MKYLELFAVKSFYTVILSLACSLLSSEDAENARGNLVYERTLHGPLLPGSNRIIWAMISSGVVVSIKIDDEVVYRSDRAESDVLRAAGHLPLGEYLLDILSDMKNVEFDGRLPGSVVCSIDNTGPNAHVTMSETLKGVHDGVLYEISSSDLFIPRPNDKFSGIQYYIYSAMEVASAVVQDRIPGKLSSSNIAQRPSPVFFLGLLSAPNEPGNADPTD